VTTAQAIGAALRARHLELALRLAATVLYGASAGALLHEQPRLAAATMVAVWLVGVGLAAARRPPRHAGKRR
jgi:hypothetical protein